ncbi:MAG TPA: chemotaxis-specific protein-glutamate methyltransferase CheB [Roseiflexaceae bacterium]|nr:chemotaxis-specific protein-glutamate methyltransferase CheB [Roseiflexaceae bacterium]
MSQPIRVLVVDDSALMRRVLTSLLEQDPAIRVVATARNGREAIELVQELRPDIVTMDVRMPVMDGLATTEHLMAYCPTPILVLTASLASHEVDITFKMLGAGALEVIEKPSGSDAQALDHTGRALIRRIKVLARVKVVTHLRGRRKPAEMIAALPDLTPNTAGGKETRRQAPASITRHPSPVAHHPSIGADIPLIVIGASTGGPRVVNEVLAGLPSGLPSAVLVVQHIAQGFSAGMAEWLANASRLPVRLAHEGQPIRAGEVLIAPDARDLLITRQRTVHLSEDPLLIQRPSIDISMQAAAEVFGPRAIGVLLTGMGRDGAYGMLTIKRSNGYTIAQDEATCTIFGMPRAAIQLHAAREVLPAPRIASRLVELVTQLDPARLASARGAQ